MFGEIAVRRAERNLRGRKRTHWLKMIVAVCSAGALTMRGFITKTGLVLVAVVERAVGVEVGALELKRNRAQRGG